MGTKTITLSEEDYNSLMDLCKEMQIQENDGQAHPYFWEPMSSRYVTSPDDEGEVMFHYDCENYTPEEMWNGGFEEMKKSFLELECDDKEEKDVIYSEIEDEWVSFIEETGGYDFTKWYSVLEQKSEHNPSLFKSDVKDFIQYNKHH